MIGTYVEAQRNRIIITGETADAVRMATLEILTCCSPAFADFTSPVRQADGAFVATGLVRLAE